MEFKTLFVWIAEVGGTINKNPRTTYLPPKGQVHKSVIGRDHIVYQRTSSPTNYRSNVHDVNNEHVVSVETIVDLRHCWLSYKLLL
jgi:hypothetical protein